MEFLNGMQSVSQYTFYVPGLDNSMKLSRTAHKKSIRRNVGLNTTSFEGSTNYYILGNSSTINCWRNFGKAISGLINFIFAFYSPCRVQASSTSPFYTTLYIFRAQLNLKSRGAASWLLPTFVLFPYGQPSVHKFSILALLSCVCLFSN